MQIITYLAFDGQCAAAFKRYAEILGGKAEVLTHGESPMAGETPKELRDRVLHARLDVGSQVLMGADSPPGLYEGNKGFSVSIGVDDTPSAERIFDALAEGGTVRMPLQKTFWAASFGMLIDRFGIPWMVNCETGR